MPRFDYPKFLKVFTLAESSRPLSGREIIRVARIRKAIEEMADRLNFHSESDAERNYWSLALQASVADLSLVTGVQYPDDIYVDMNIMELIHATDSGLSHVICPVCSKFILLQTGVGMCVGCGHIIEPPEATEPGSEEK